MRNFKFYNPTKIFFGKGEIASISEQIPHNARVMITLGGESAKKNGTLAQAESALGDRYRIVFSGIEANPSYKTLMHAVDEAKKHGIDYFLAIGGGSVIDGTKFIAAAMLYQDSPWQILEKGGATISRAMPFGSILTLPATGSEANSNSVVTNYEIKAKLAFASPYVFPQFSVLDPTLTYSLPKRQLANGVVDAFIHVLEQYLTTDLHAMVQDRFAESLLLNLIELSPKLLQAETPNYDDRANFMWTASLALNGLIAAGVDQDWSTHRIGHELTALYGIDHARTLSMILPALLTVRKEAKKAKLLQFAKRVWQIHEGSDDAKIEAAISKTRDFFASLDMPVCLADCNLGQEAIEAVLDQLGAHKMQAIGEDGGITPAVSRCILQLAAH